MRISHFFRRYLELRSRLRFGSRAGAAARVWNGPDFPRYISHPFLEALRKSSDSLADRVVVGKTFPKIPRFLPLVFLLSFQVFFFNIIYVGQRATTSPVLQRLHFAKVSVLSQNGQTLKAVCSLRAGFAFENGPHRAGKETWGLKRTTNEVFAKNGPL